ncbi:class I SAM-dependent methyltransferase [Paenibacillus sp. ISL-20]|uniref:class I SAM-dependent methyltransferase n=1 Tax=Paenibacillus sp. ISL-20 TaxID=2819163 RepID=UPI001BE9967F|nr:class I SAM-dependent methyltransferase [Paenibacillus sp. ISL-20]MBT2763311.1 methyltransferase domain-containing protein [Paenibacillus sp. ISL-20]
MKYDLNVDLTSNTSHSLILSRIQPCTRVLEFGSATGYMTKYMKEKLNCEVVCIEIDSEAAQKASKYAEQMILADIDTLSWQEKIKGQKFDYILFADVLEHLRRPDAVLITATSFLNEDGYVMTSIPNISHNSIIMELLEGKFNYQKEGLLDDTHIHFFTRKSVLSLLKDVGLEPVEWLTTMRTPETTEFKQNYNNFPLAVQSLLKNRIDGDVYQFVTVSKKCSTEWDLSRYDQIQHENYLDGDYCQLYWRAEGDFSEICSALLPVDFNKGFSTYRFEIPNGNWNSLRFDPANTLVYGEIKNIRLMSVNENEVSKKREISLEDLLSISEIITLDKQKYKFISLDNDPQILLKDLNLEINNRYYLELEMRLENNIPNIIKELLTFNDKIQELHMVEKTENEQLKKVIMDNELQFKEQLQLYRNKIQELEYNISEMASEISGYEAKVFQVDSELKSTQEKLDNLKREREAIYSSYSWRITSPFRALANKIRARKEE